MYCMVEQTLLVVSFPPWHCGSHILYFALCRVALATDTTGCSIYDYAEEFCCPNAQHAIDTVTDEGTENRDEPTGGGDIITTPTNCHFCDNGIEFPTARPMSGDDTTCQQVANM